MRRGEHLYLIRNVLTGAVKVGSSGDVPSRLRQLAGNAGQPMELLAVVPGGGALERRLHTALIQDRTIGEWFSPSPQLLALVAEAQADRWPGRVIERFVGWEDPSRPRDGDERREYLERNRKTRGNAARRRARQKRSAARVAELRGDWWRRFVTPTGASNA